MKLEGDYLFEAPVRDVWSALFDPEVLAAVMPGCEKLELLDGSFVGELNIKIGPVQGKFAGKVELKDVDEPRSFAMVVDGKGSTGFMKATASVKLEAEGEGTRIRYSADATVGGKIASVGQRLVEVSARAISKQALEGLHENVKIRAEAAAQAAAAKKARQEAKAAAAAEAAAAAAEAAAKAAVAEEAKAPVAEEAKAAVVEEAKAAVVEEAKAAVVEEAKAAVAEEAKAAVAEEAKAPVAEEAKVPVAEDAKAPVVEEARAPVVEEAKAETPAGAVRAAPEETESKPAAAETDDEDDDEPHVPAPALKKVDQAAFAASVAKEVSKELVPAPVRIGLVLAVLGLVVWLVWRTMG